MARNKKSNRSIESIIGRFSAIPHCVLDSVAFQEASHTAKALLFDLIRQHNGANNGHLHLSQSWLRARGWNSNSVVQRAKEQLKERELIVQTKQGGLNIGASLFAVTWIHISNYVGLDIQSMHYHPGAWAAMNNLPIAKLKTPSLDEVRAVPSEGAVQPRKQIRRKAPLSRREVRK